MNDRNWPDEQVHVISELICHIYGSSQIWIYWNTYGMVYCCQKTETTTPPLCTHADLCVKCSTIRTMILSAFREAIVHPLMHILASHLLIYTYITNAWTLNIVTLTMDELFNSLPSVCSIGSDVKTVPGHLLCVHALHCVTELLTYGHKFSI